MKKHLPLLFLAVFPGLRLKAQLFSQNFSSSNLVAAYVNATGEINKLTNIGSGTNNQASITNQALRFSKTGSNGAYFTRNVNFSASAPNVLKIQLSLQVTNNLQPGTTQFQLYVGNGFSNSGTVPTGTNTHSKLVFDLGGANNFNISSSTGSTTPTALYNTEQILTWVINNSGSNFTYLAPDGATQKVLANDKWDLYVGNTAIPVLADKDGLPNSTAGNGKDNALQNIYFSYPSTSQNATIDIDNVSVEELTGTLPVSLISFSGKPYGETIKLKWLTASEENNASFDILRATDGKNFEKIGQIAGKGNTAQTYNYAFEDAHPLPSTNYYQLKQIDENGRYTLSSVIGIRANTTTNFKLLARGNQLELTAYSPQNTQATFSLFDINGNTLIRNELHLVKGYNTLSIHRPTTAKTTIASIRTADQVYSQKILP